MLLTYSVKNMEEQTRPEYIYNTKNDADLKWGHFIESQEKKLL